MQSNIILKELNKELSGKPVKESLEKLVSVFGKKIIFTTSFGIEDQVITHFIFSNNIPVRVVTLDTGRLFRETYDVFSRTLTRYGKKIEVFYPEHSGVEKMVTEKGPYSFYDSRENREECCRVRKVVPLSRALEGMECWVTGIRADQSDNRSLMSALEYDEARKMFKYHPLFDWSFEDVENYIRGNGIPYNALHDKGYPSIGCEPCTRAVAKGEDFRAGRWWWEQEGHKECGVHFKA